MVALKTWHSAANDQSGTSWGKGENYGWLGEPYVDLSQMTALNHADYFIVVYSFPRG